jgi:hypothetical protein
VLMQAIGFEKTLQAKDDGALWLAISNGEYDEEYAEHLAESRGQDSYASDAFIKAYVQETRRRRGWAALRDHPRLEEMIHAWITVVRDESGKCDQAELSALLDKSFGSFQEAHFWDMAEAAWNETFASKLLQRMVAGHDNSDVRRAAASCFLRCDTRVHDQLFGLLPNGNHARLLEIFLDLRSKWRRKRHRKALRPFVQKALAVVPGGLAPAARALLENFASVPVLTGDAVGMIRQLDFGANMELALEKAKLLAAAGEDVSTLVHMLVERPRSDGADDIAYAKRALELAALQGHSKLVEASLAHRFADVRCVALETLAARTEGALASALLALAHDKGSRVRQALAKILEARPAPAHTACLIILAADDWSDRRHYYGQEANFPIAQAAAHALKNGGELPKSAIEPLIEISIRTNDPEVRSCLIGAVAGKGGPEGIGRVCDLAISRESIRMSTDAAWALYVVHDKVDATTAARLTPQQVISRNENVSVCMALCIGASAPVDQVRETAKILSSSPKRRALLVPLTVGATENIASLAVEAAKLLPPDREKALLAVLSGGPKLARDAIDDLGDIRIVKAVVERLDPIFVRESE